MRCDGLRVVTVLGVFGWSQKVKLVAALRVAAPGPAERTCLLLYLPPSDTLLYNLLSSSVYYLLYFQGFLLVEYLFII